jgi:UDP-N-acetylglucosamine 2-epimerase
MQALVTHVLGARPNFMKAAPVIRALGEAGVDQALIHTGQHYDARMSGVFFADLGLPEPDVNLHVGSGAHGEQTAAVIAGVERELTARRPALLVVYGDVNSTLGAALAAAKLHVPVAHVEAGLRSFDNTMPEEINRRLTDPASGDRAAGHRHQRQQPARARRRAGVRRPGRPGPDAGLHASSAG